MNQDHREREYNAWQEEEMTEVFDASSATDSYYYDPTEGQNTGPGQIFCPNCGAPNSFGSRFCENCGCSLESVPDPQGEMPPGSEKKFSPIIIVVAVLLLLAAGAAFWFVMNHDSDDGNSSDTGTEETTQADETDDSGDSDGSDQTIEAITNLEEGDVTVLSSDWDWDSAHYDSSQGMYRVDAILYVKNSLDKPITGIDFAVLDKNWNEVENDIDPDESLFASGYINAGSKGVMVGQVWSYKKKVRPNDDTYQIQTVYTNNALEGYVVPYGKITKKYGPNGDYYDIVLTNPNDTDVYQDAIIVAVKLSGNKIKDSDATGEIDRPIPAHAEGFKQKKAFNDPNILTDPSEMEVYAIDTGQLANE